jgi:hypothetical protein
MINMTTRTRSTQRPEQLTLLAPSALPVQFRLDQRTRQLGLSHIAAIRQQLAARTVTAATPVDAVPAPTVPVAPRKAA